jgi:hypothetical protein
MTTSADKELLRVPQEEYGDKYRDHLLEQYKLFVMTADRISERRVSANNYLLTVNAFLVTFYGIASGFDSRVGLLMIPVAGILVCTIWVALLRSYRNLNTAKFKVIHELERRLPAAVFEREWEVAKRSRSRYYKPFTHIEPGIPYVFASLYALVIVYAVVSRMI